MHEWRLAKEEKTNEEDRIKKKEERCLATERNEANEAKAMTRNILMTNEVETNAQYCAEERSQEEEEEV